MLISKARAALERYGHQIVIGNDLATRKFEVVFVKPNNAKETWLRLSKEQLDQGEEIEQGIVNQLEKLHTEWIHQK